MRETGLVDVRLTQQVPSVVTYVGHLKENAQRQLALHAQAVVHRAANVQIRTDSRNVRQQAGGRRRAAGRIGQVAVLKGRDLREWRGIQQREDDVAFGLVVENPDSAANGGAAVV